jgi:hypothetical protein
MSPTTLSKSRKKKQRKEQKDALVLLGDSQATHEYEFKDDEELRLESVLFGTPLAGSSSSNGTKKGKEVVDVSMGHLLDEEVSVLLWYSLSVLCLRNVAFLR